MSSAPARPLPDPATIPGLTATARLVLIKLHELTRRSHAECWLHARTIAEAVGCCAATVRAALRQLEAAGLVRIVRDYALKVRRRIVLLWRTGEHRGPTQALLPFDRPAADTSVAQDVCRDSGQTSCATNASPLHPPYKDPEGICKTERIDDDARPLADAERPEPAKAPQGSSSSGDSPPGIRGPEPSAIEDHAQAEAEAAVARAVEVFGPDHATRARALAGAFGAEPVRRAVDLAEPKVRREGKAWGYVVGIVRNWSIEGMPAAAAPPPDPREQRRSMMAEAMRIFRQRRAPGDGR